MKNVQSLFIEAGFKIIDVEFVLVPPHTANLWWPSNHSGVNQVVIKAISDLTPDKGLALLSMRVPIEAQAQLFIRTRMVEALKAKLRPYISRRMRRHVIRMLRQWGVKV